MQVFCAISYNVHQCVGLDGRRDPARIADIIRESGADIVGLQEVHSVSGDWRESHQMDYLAEETGLQAVPGHTMVRENSNYGNVLLTSRRILNIQWVDLSVPGREPRGAIDADIEIGGETVRVIVTHLGLGPAERRYQARRLLTALAEERTQIVVLLSDINEWLPRGRPLSWLQARLGRTAPLRTFPSFFPLFPLDRIWVHPSQLLVNLSIYQTPLTRIASDHLPLKAVICTAAPSDLSDPASTLSDNGDRTRGYRR
ncbi:MAG: endonuclease/exonuclease/phosphatase family protein [Deltaproteobacteria bacterium]|nr:endonuclease/exonuclease/phosphatase family protein [Deltaproteobacteria bacterium]